MLRMASAAAAEPMCLSVLSTTERLCVVRGPRRSRAARIGCRAGASGSTSGALDYVRPARPRATGAIGAGAQSAIGPAKPALARVPYIAYNVFHMKAAD